MISLVIDCVRWVFAFALRGAQSQEVLAALHTATVAGDASQFQRRLLMCIPSFSRAPWVTGHFANGGFFPRVCPKPPGGA